MQHETFSVGVRAYVSQNLQKKPEFPDPQVILFEIQLSARIIEAPALQKFVAFTPFPLSTG